MIVFLVRLIRANIELTKKIIIGVVAFIVLAGSCIVYNQLFSIEADTGQIILALNQADKSMSEYHNKTGKYPLTINDIIEIGEAWPKISGGYRLADGYNLTNEEVVINRVEDRNCGANRAAVTINYQPYDVEHVKMVLGK